MSIEGLLHAENHIEAINSRDPEELLAALQATLGIRKFHKAAKNFIESTAAVSLIKGPFRVRGMGSIDLGTLTEKAADLSWPALPVGGTEGCDFWLRLDSGRVSALPPAPETSDAPPDESSPRDFQDLGELDVTQLVALQTALYAAFGEVDPPRGPRYLRVVAESLGGLRKLAKINEQAPLAFLGDIDAKMLRDMVSAEKRWARVLKRVEKDEIDQVRVLDFSHARLVELPLLGDFTHVEAVDLRGNPELDPQEVFESVAPLDRLRRIDVSLCHWDQAHVVALRELLPACRVVDETPRGAPAIAAAVKAGVDLTTLDLSGLDLRRLPPQMRQLTELTELDLSHNPKLDFTFVFAQLASLPKLRKLDLRACGLHKLPPQISKLTALEDLDLTCGSWGDHNQLNVTDALPLIGEIPGLRRLSLDGGKVLPGQWRKTLKLIGDELAGLEHLGMAGWATLENSGRMFSAEIQQMLVTMGKVESARLGGLGIKALEPTLEELPLRELDISKSDIRTVAPAQLEALEVLVARGTSLVSLEGLERCRKLRVLDIVGPRGAQSDFSFPDWLDWLSELETLTVQNLAFTEVPENISALTQLESLSLSSQKLTALPESLGELKKLRSLVLNDLVAGCDALEELPETLGQLQALETLIASNGGLRRLPESIRDCTALTTVELDGLDLADPMGTANMLSELPALRRLSLAFSGLTRLPESFAQCETLTDVRILGDFASYAQAARVICSLPRLERLDLSRFALASLPANFSECVSLRALHYETPRGHTALSPEMLFSALSRLPNFQELSIDDIAGHFRELPTSVGDLTRLEKLTLSSVGFGKLPKEMARLHNLRELHLDRCPAIKAGEVKRLRKALPECTIHVTDW